MNQLEKVHVCTYVKLKRELGDEPQAGWWRSGEKVEDTWEPEIGREAGGRWPVKRNTEGLWIKVT